MECRLPGGAGHGGSARPAAGRSGWWRSGGPPSRSGAASRRAVRPRCSSARSPGKYSTGAVPSSLVSTSASLVTVGVAPGNSSGAMAGGWFEPSLELVTQAQATGRLSGSTTVTVITAGRGRRIVSCRSPSRRKSLDGEAVGLPLVAVVGAAVAVLGVFGVGLDLEGVGAGRNVEGEGAVVRRRRPRCSGTGPVCQSRIATRSHRVAVGVNDPTGEGLHSPARGLPRGGPGPGERRRCLLWRISPVGGGGCRSRAWSGSPARIRFSLVSAPTA